MSFIRDNPRKIKSATQIDAINRVLEKYIDFKELYVHREFGGEPVQFIGRPHEDTFLLHFTRPIEEERIAIYTIARDRFIEFALDMVSPAGPPHPENSYSARIVNCTIALDKRDHERTVFEMDFPAAANIATIKIQEREQDFRKSLSVRMIVEEYINRMEGVDIKKVSFKDDKDISPAVAFVVETGKTLHLPDTSGVSGFFKENENYFDTTNSVELRDDLRQWLQNNSAAIPSLLVMPIPYHPLVGRDFPMAYLTVINKDKSITAGDVGRIDAFLEGLSERVRNGNLIETKAEGKIIDVSAGGAKIHLGDAQIIDKLVSQNVIMMDMVFKEGNPIIISGRLVWVYMQNGSGYMAGIDFTGSHFGPNMKSALAVHIKDFLSRNKKRAQ